MRRPPFLIGLTGNIATGKSEVARMLAALGARIIDADRVAHEVMRLGGPAYGAVIDAFGQDILASDGSIDRVKLGAIVFRNPDDLCRLEAAVHPAVLDEVERHVVQAAEEVVVIEAIKLVETGMHQQCDLLWVVTAPRSLQIARLVEARGLTEAEAALRVDSQPPQARKAALADMVLVNDGSLAKLQHEVERAWAQIPLGKYRDSCSGGACLSTELRTTGDNGDVT